MIPTVAARLGDVAATGPTHLAAGFYDAGIGRFLLSPGFGGLAVLVGGGLTYAAALRKSRDERAAAADDVRSARDRLALDGEAARQAQWRFTKARAERLHVRAVDADDTTMSAENSDASARDTPYVPPQHAVIWLTTPAAVEKHARLVREIDEDLARRRARGSNAS